MSSGADDWAIRHVDVDDVPAQSRVVIAPVGDAITLEVAEAGVIDVSKCGCTITAAAAGLHDQLRAIGEDWALGQWLAFNGTFAFHGATLEREGFGLALIGAPRAGTSLTALALARRGWRLIADGTCPLVVGNSADGGEHIVALPGRQRVQVDRTITAAFPPDEGCADAGTPRPRSEIPVASTGAHRVDRIISIVPSNVRREGVIVPGDRDGGDPPQILRSCAVVGDALQATSPHLAERLASFCDIATHLAPLDAALVPAGKATFVFSPRQIADLIDAHVDSIRDAAGDTAGVTAFDTAGGAS